MALLQLRSKAWAAVLGLAIAAMLPLSGCGGGAGGAGGAGQGLVLVSFDQDSLDNVSLNTKLVFRFSEAVDPATVTEASVQVREGPDFGLTVKGRFKVDGAIVTFEPVLPGLCDLSDAAFKADTQYRVQLVGFPEEFSIRNLSGQHLNTTSTREFHTRLDTDPALFTDQVPGTGPTVVTSLPAQGREAVKVQDGNRVVLTMSENIKPCSVNATSVLFNIYQFGDPATTVAADGGAGNASGFATDALPRDTSDQTPGDPFTWTTPAIQALSVPLPAPQKILAQVDLVQSFDETQIIITPDFGYNPDPLLNKSRFPENALVVVQLTFDVQDYAGLPLTPFTLAFTTENLPLQNSTYDVETKGETPWDVTLTTARIIETGVGLVQGFLLFSGDGDNGADLLSNSLPQSDAGTCVVDYQANDATPDAFDPSGDVLLDTGGTPNPCPNSTDGSFAVVFEFNSFHIRANVTVRVVGVNPAIILVQGDARIDAGGRLLVRGDNQGGAPRGDGQGNKTATTTSGTAGGVGVAGGGDGGACLGGNGVGTARYAGTGEQGYYHDPATGPLAADVGTTTGPGCGKGNTSAQWTSQSNPNNRNSPGGGGGGHAEDGGTGVAKGTGSSPTKLDLPLKGEGGQEYGDSNSKLLKPEAGSGGGAGGEVRPFTSNAGRGPGGGGGAGGGFIDLTSGGDIVILGTLDAAGGRGGTNPGGNFNPNYSWQPGTGGGGGGSGGGIRLLTPRDIVFGASSVITAAGGAGGAGGASQGTDPGTNDGGDGASGRIALEDSNSVISGIAGAAVVPGEGAPGFYRGVFDAARFKGGGTRPTATSEVFALGPFNPTFVNPTAGDFKALAPIIASNGQGSVVMMIEARGFQILPDGSADLTGVITPPTPWHTVCHFTDSGVEIAPTMVLSMPPLLEIGGLPTGNTGVFGLTNLDGSEYIQLRVSFYLKSNIGATDPGHALDLWRIRFSSDQ